MTKGECTVGAESSGPSRSGYTDLPPSASPSPAFSPLYDPRVSSAKTLRRIASGEDSLCADCIQNTDEESAFTSEWTNRRVFSKMEVFSPVASSM